MPNIGIVQAGRQGMADRFTYIPMMGFSVAIVWLAWECYERYPSTRRPLQLGFASVLVELVLLTSLQIPVWHDSISLFDQAVRVNPDDEFVQGNLATALMEASRNEDALPHLEKAIASAPANGSHWQNLALVDYSLDRIPDAEQAVRRAMALRPDHFEPLALAARIEFRAGYIDQTWSLLRAAMKRGAPAAMTGTMANDFGASLARKGRIAEAEPFFRIAIGSEPCQAKSARNLQAALEDLGRAVEAAEVWKSFQTRCLVRSRWPQN
jgi:tetratricopeptide (TPR) repeat protein